MKRICYSVYHSGPRQFGEKEPILDQTETHGLCDSCFLREMEEVEKILKNEADNSFKSIPTEAGCKTNQNQSLADGVPSGKS